MVSKVVSLAIALLIMIAGLTANGQTMQTMTRTYTSDSGPIEAYNIPGLGAALMEADGKISVVFVPPADHRPTEFKEVDLESDDIIIMCNGKRTKTMAVLREQIESVEYGEEVKLAVRRGKERLLVRFQRPDPEAYPMQQQMVMMTADAGDGSGGKVTTVDGRDASVEIDLKAGQEIALVMEAGILLSDSDEGLKVLQILPAIGVAAAEEGVEVGFLITQIHGQPVTNTHDFNEIYLHIPSGEQFEIVFSNGDETLKKSWIKQEAQPGQVIQIGQ